MASLLPKLAFLIFILSTLLFPITNSFKSIFSFGDSLADTGNILHSGSIATYLYARPPYGETHFRRPTGRCSDGRLIVDFFAEAYGLPLLPPYLSGSPGKDFRQGVNFAVVGATALDNSFFEERGIINPLTTNSLSDQISWFKELLPSLCATPKDCIDYLGNSLFLVGEIGGNDVNYGFLQGRSMQEVRGFVPNIIDAITSAIRSLIKEGAMELVVPGNLPFGCSPIYLTMFQSSSKSEYDSLGCLSSFNDFSIYFNTQLQEALQKLRLENPHVKIIYADYYNASLRFYKSPLQFGFKETLSACCGGGGPYNYNILALCGLPHSDVCHNSSSYASWDGVHLTEAAYQAIATGLIRGPYSTPSITVP